MDFTYIGGNNFGTDQISAATPMNYNMNDIFVTPPKVKKVLSWPTPTSHFPNPPIEPVASSGEVGLEGFVDQWGNQPHLTESTLVALLVIVLVIMCAVIYSTVRQTNELIKLMATMSLAAKK